VVDVTYENDENEAPTQRQDIVPMPDLPSRSAEDDEEIEGT
jgi:hypothetical protein